MSSKIGEGGYLFRGNSKDTISILTNYISCPQIKSYLFRVNLRNPARLIKPKPPRTIAGSSSMKKGSGVYNLAMAYKVGGASNITVSIAKNT
jgi:hypothetical protein